MTEPEIIKAVRLAMDEDSDYPVDFEDTNLDNIIKAKVGDALRWCSLYAEGSMLGGGDEDSEAAKPLLKEYDFTVPDGGGSTELTDIGYNDGVITLPLDVLRVVRVRCEGWHKAVMKPVDEDSDEYLMLYDATATATKDRPVAALIESTPQRLELWPKPSVGEKVELTVAQDVPLTATVVTKDDEELTVWNVPPKMKGAMVYYIAFLVLVAYNDQSKAKMMLEVAKMELGVRQES